MPHAIKTTPEAARRFLIAVHRIERPFADIDGALAHHGYVQIDPINVCGRMHDLILRNRVSGYREGGLMVHLHGRADPSDDKPPASEHSLNPQPPNPHHRRTAFEHHLPHSHVLVAFPVEAWPHLASAMQARSRRTSAWSGRLTPRQKELAPVLLREIGARGPMGSADFEDPGRSRMIWGRATLAKATLQKLFFHGRLLIAGRVNNQRKYDLPGRVLPGDVLAQPAPSPAETARWIALLKVRQYRLAQLRRSEALAAGDDIVPVEIDGCPPLFCLRSDAPLLHQSANPKSQTSSPQKLPQYLKSQIPDHELPAPFPNTPSTFNVHPSTGAAAPPARLLAPLDPLIYQRRVTQALWDFDYTWEVYTPPGKRVRGYYALPVLSGTRIVGHVDPKADRAAGRLRIVSKKVRRGHAVAPAITALARFLGLGLGKPKPRSQTAR